MDEDATIHDLTFLPLDFPRFEGQQEVRDNFSPLHSSAIWEQNRLVESYARDGLPYASERDWLPEARERMPKLIEFVEQHLPFRSVCMAKILKSNDTKLGIHVDIGKYDWPDYEYYRHLYYNAPSAYRIVLDGEGENILYYTDGPDTPREHWCWAKMPPDTNSFIHSATDSLHGAEYHVGLERYILFIHGWLDAKKHAEILRRSYAKYKDYAISFADIERHRWPT